MKVRRHNLQKVELVDFVAIKKFANVAYLVDREDFLKDIRNFRLWLQKETRVQLPIQWESKIAWEKSLWKPVSKGKLKQIEKEIAKSAKAYWFAVVTDSLTNEIKNKYEQVVRQNPSEGFWLEIKRLRWKYHQPLLVEKVVAKAIIHHEIHEEDYENCYADVLYQISDYPFIYDEPLLAIVLGPDTKFGEIERVFKEQIPPLKKQHQELGLAPKYLAVGDREKPKIFRDRMFYWLYQEGKSYKQIANVLDEHRLRTDHEPSHNERTCESCNDNSDYKDIGDAVERYQQWLNRS